MVACAERLKLSSSPAEMPWDLCEMPAGRLCPWDPGLRPATFSLSLQQIHEAQGLKPFSTGAEQEGREGKGRKKIPSSHIIAWKCNQRKFIFLHSLTVIAGYAARLNFWILIVSPLFPCEISNAMLPSIQILKVTPRLLVNLCMLPQIETYSVIRQHWQIHRVQRREGKESGKLDFLGEPLILTKRKLQRGLTLLLLHGRFMVADNFF